MSDSEREVLIPLFPKDDFHVRLYLEKENKDLKHLLKKALTELNKQASEREAIIADDELRVKLKEQRKQINRMEKKLKGMKLYRQAYIAKFGVLSFDERLKLNEDE